MPIDQLLTDKEKHYFVVSTLGFRLLVS